jgi:hypothetical protein
MTQQTKIHDASRFSCTKSTIIRGNKERETEKCDRGEQDHYLSNVHSARGFESVIADGRFFEFEKAKELIVLDAFFSDAPDEREPFLRG